MKELVIIGAGDFGRETMWLAERIKEVKPQWNILGFVDDGKAGELIDGYHVIGCIDWLRNCEREIFVICAIASGITKERILSNLCDNANIRIATLIDPSVVIGNDAVVEAGCIVCAGTVLAIHTHLHKNCIVNFNCTIGHDTELGAYCTVHPGCNISGKVTVGERCLLGTGAKIIQGLHVSADTILGAGTVVVQNITESGTYVGIPARKIK